MVAGSAVVKFYRSVKPCVAPNGGEFLLDRLLADDQRFGKRVEDLVGRPIDPDDVRVAGGDAGATFKLPAGIAALRGWALVGGGAVDGRDLSAHGAQVRRQLASMMDGIEENEPQKCSHRLLRGEFSTIVELRALIPGRFVHLGNSIGELV